MTTVVLLGFAALATAAVAGAQPDTCELGDADDSAYVCRASTDPEDFAWADTANGTDVPLSADDVEGPYQLGIEFPWYGDDVTSIHVSSNGYVCLGDTTNCAEDDGQEVPSTPTPNDLVACSWTPLDPRDDTIRFEDNVTIDGVSASVVEFQSVSLERASGSNTFQIQLLENGNARCMLDTISKYNDRNTAVGTENATGEDGVRYKHEPFTVNKTSDDPDQVRVLIGEGLPAPENLAAERWFQQNNLTWDPPTDEQGNELDVDHYNITVYNATGAVLGYEETAADVTSFTDDDNNQHVPAPGDDETRSYEVAGVDDFGKGANAGPVNATTYGEPSAPLNIVAEPGTSHGEVALAWDAPAHPNETDTYHTYFANREKLGGSCAEQPNTTKAPWTAGPDVSPPTTEATIENGSDGLALNTHYCFTVTADNDDGSGPGVGEGAPGAADASIPAGPPSEPRNPDAAQVDGTDGPKLEVEVSWDPPELDGGSDVTGYLINRSVSLFPGTGFTGFGERADADASPFHDTAVECGRTYRFEVAARNGLGTGPTTDPVNATITGFCHSPPQDPSAVAGDNSADTPPTDAIEVSWNEPAENGTAGDVENYRVYRCSQDDCSGNGVWSQIAETGNETFAVEDDGLSEDTTYTYQIVALNESGQRGLRSDLVSATIASAPDAPQEVEASNEGNDETINVTWTPPSDDGGAEVLEYHVYQRSELDLGSSFQKVGTVPADQTHLVVEADAGHYCYAVSADNTFEGDKSPEDPSVNGDACATAGGTAPDAALDCSGLLADTPICPSAPSNVIGQQDALTVSLDWDANADFPAGQPVEDALTYYRVYRVAEDCQELAAEDFGDGDVIAEPSEPGHDDTDLAADTTYCYAVSAVRGHKLVGGFLALESALNVTGPFQTPAPPSPPTAVSVTSPADGETEVTWQAPDHANGTVSYTVERDDACTGSWSPVNTTPDTSEAEGNLSAGEYCYRVIADDDIGTSQPSGSDSATVANSEPTEPWNVNATRQTAGEICVTWDRPNATGGSPLDSYVIERKAEDGDWSEIDSQAADGTREYCDDGLAQGVTFTYRIAAVNTELDEDGNQVPGEQGPLSAADGAEA